MPLGQGTLDVRHGRLVAAAVAQTEAGDGPAQGVQVVAAEVRPLGGPRHVETCPLHRRLQRILRHLQPHLAVVNPQDLTPGVGVGVGNVQVELEAARPQQGRVENLREVRRADDEDHFFLVEAVHLGQQLVDHRMLDAAAGVGAAGRGEGIQLVEHDYRRCGLAGLVEDLSQPLFAFSYPFTL